MEARTLVALARLVAPAKLPEVLDSLGNDTLEELEDDAAPLGCMMRKDMVSWKFSN